METAIRQGTVVTPAGPRNAAVGIEADRIVAISPDLRGHHEIDATGCLVIPGGVDPHVHLQMALGDYVSADDFASGTLAAACGGTTTVIDFVEPRPGETLVGALEKRRAEADGRVAVDYALHMTIPPWHASRPDVLASLPVLVAEGITSFKLYMAYEGLRLDDGQLYQVMRAVSRAGGLPIVHCENGPVCDVLRQEAIDAGRTGPINHALTRPPLQEAEATARLIDLAAMAGSPVYVVHVSCEASWARILQALDDEVAIAAETCPQYLLLDQSALEGDHGERYVCAPPLRSGDQLALWHALSVGGLQVLATDHCPFTAAEKAGHPDFTSIPGGLPSIEIRLSAAYGFGRRLGLRPSRWIEACSANAASLFGLRRKGRIETGYDADLVVFDPQSTRTVHAGQTLHERVDWSPYEGMQIDGWPRTVLSRGRVVVRDGEYVGEAGWGRYVPRQASSLLA